MRLTGKEMATASQGVWLDEVPNAVTGIGTDSRDFITGQAFLALRGENFDGHSHAYKVADQASALIGDKLGVQQWQTLMETPQLEVSDTLIALGDIAASHRRKLTNTKVVAITGSYGKTTVRSMITHTLETLGLEVAATKENFNNLIGVPKTLLSVEQTADVALIECGISELGEMERLSEIVQPDIAIVTGLTHAHGEGLGGLTGVAREKAKLMSHLLPQGWVVLGQGVKAQFAQADCLPQQVMYAMDESDAVSWELDGQSLTLSHAGVSSELHLSLPANHWAEDMALSAMVVLKLALDLDKSWSVKDVAESLQTWSAVEGRMRVYPETTNQTFTLIDDSYNANPASMQAALDTLASLDGYRIAIIGDMLELGEQAVSSHAELNLHDIDEVITVGSMMQILGQINPERKVHSFADVSQFVFWLKQQHNFPAGHSKTLLKSSHGIGLYQIASLLMNRGQHVI